MLLKPRFTCFETILCNFLNSCSRFSHKFSSGQGFQLSHNHDLIKNFQYSSYWTKIKALQLITSWFEIHWLDKSVFSDTDYINQHRYEHLEDRLVYHITGSKFGKKTKWSYFLEIIKYLVNGRRDLHDVLWNSLDHAFDLLVWYVQ